MMNNPMQPQMGTAPELSEEELRKLALLLQQMPQGEGLAAVSPVEEQQMKADGGAGTPLPGTQGLGPAGGPVKSYAKKEDGIIDEDHRLIIATNAEVEALNYLKHQDKDQGYPTGNGPFIQALAQMNTHDLDYHTVKGMRVPSLNAYGGMTQEEASAGVTQTYGGGGGGESDLDKALRKESEEALEKKRKAREDRSFGKKPKAETKPTTYSFNWESDPKKSFTENLSANWDRLDVVGWFNSLPDAEMPQDIRFEKDAAVIQQYYRDNPEKLLGDDGSGGLIAQQGGPAAVAAAQAAIQKEKSTVDISKMVETMNNHFAKAEVDENTTYDEFKASIESAKAPAVLYVEGDVLPQGAAIGDVKTPAVEGFSTSLSESTLRAMYETARKKYQRGEAFTLTPAEVAEFERAAIQTATAGNFKEWWAGQGGTGGLYATEAEAKTAHAAAQVGDAEEVTIGDIEAATLTDVGDVAEVDETTVDAIASVTDEDIDEIFSGGTDKAEALLLARIDGTADSPAERQLFRTSEQNLRMLLGATAGGDADPAKVRQLKNVWQDMTQHAVGEAADLRSQESLAAEAQLVELYKGKDTMKLNTKLANMEKEKQVAFKNGDLALAGKLANQQTVLQKVITKASLDVNTKLANLETVKETMIAQGKLDVATSIANLQKDITLSTVNARLAVESRAMDDAIAMNAYKGQQALYGLEAEIDMDTLKADLTKMGFELQRDLATMDAETRKEVARLTGDYNKAIASDQRDAQKEASILSAIGLGLGAYAALSDVQAKTNISPGSGEVESFLDALNSYKYEYKDPAGSDEAGMFVGVMAQDLEKTPMGASFVKDTPRGKQVDYGHGLAAILASQANIHDRLRNLEEG